MKKDIDMLFEICLRHKTITSPPIKTLGCQFRNQITTCNVYIMSYIASIRISAYKKHKGQKSNCTFYPLAGLYHPVIKFCP
jgi:hypothetical protein